MLSYYAPILGLIYLHDEYKSFQKVFVYFDLSALLLVVHTIKWVFRYAKDNSPSLLTALQQRPNEQTEAQRQTANSEIRMATRRQITPLM